MRKAEFVDRRAVFTYIGYALGALMIIGGLGSLLGPMPHPEFATGGVTLVLASGLVGTKGNGNGNGKGR